MSEHKSLKLDFMGGIIEIEYIPDIYIFRAWHGDGKGVGTKQFLTKDELLKVGEMIKEITKMKNKTSLNRIIVSFSDGKMEISDCSDNDYLLVFSNPQSKKETIMVLCKNDLNLLGDIFKNLAKEPE